MSTIRVISTIDSLIPKIREKRKSYERLVLQMANSARNIILTRVKRGQLSNDGAFWRSNSAKRRGAYSTSQAKFRSERGLKTGSADLKVTGGLYNNFKVINKANTKDIVSYSLEFTNNIVPRPNRKTPITYNQLAEYLEDGGRRVSFSPSKKDLNSILKLIQIQSK